MNNGSQSDNKFRYSSDLLKAYSQAAIDNSLDLIKEAAILFEQKHFARAYFLAVSSIEETGKSSIAFDAIGRNLNDSAVTAKIRRSLESHDSKINAAFTAMLLASPDLSSEVINFVNLIIDLGHGREPSMYTDIRYPASEITRPKQVVREAAAQDCIRLATLCHNKTVHRISVEMPRSASRSDDQFYAMKTGKLQDLFNTEDFWRFHIDQMSAGTANLSESVAMYQQEFLQKKKLFGKRPK